MKLGTLKSSSKDGELCVVSRDLKRAVKASHIVPNLREALENWEEFAPKLQKLSQDLESKTVRGDFAVVEEDFHAALPRTWLFADGSAFIHHIKLVRQARKAALPETLLTVPLMYQGECGEFLAPRQDIPRGILPTGQILRPKSV